MAEKNNDELADALAKLASGEAPSAPDGIPSAQVPLTPEQVKPKRPAAPTSNPVKNPGPASGAATNAAARPNAPGVQPPSPKPAVPQRPRTTVSGVKPPKPVRPAAPTLSTPAARDTARFVDPADASSSLANVIEDDDAVIVPAPEPAVFAPRPAPVRVKGPPIYTRLGFRRTVIPILLTMGVALPMSALWWFHLDEDAPLRSIGLRFPIALAVIGFVMLGLGVLNVLQVKEQLSQQKP